MPNTYILLPGFDTDANEVVRKKLAASRPRVEEIASAILCSDFSKPLYVAGSFARLKTSLVYPLFAHCKVPCDSGLRGLQSLRLGLSLARDTFNK